MIPTNARQLRLALSASAAAALLLAGSLGALSQAGDQRQEKAGANPAGSTTANQQEAKKPVPWNLRFQTWEHNDSTGLGEFSGVVAESDEGTTMKSDSWKLNEKTKTAVATGNLKMTDPQADATARQADVYYAKGKRLLVMTGDVEILVKPKKETEKAGDPAAKSSAPVSPQPGKVAVEDKNPAAKNHQDATQKDTTDDSESSSASARKHPATITCDKLEYEYAKGKKHGILTGNFKVVQKLTDNTRTLTAGKAEWFGLEERIVLFPPVHVEDTKNLKEFNSDDPVTVFVKEGDERIITKKGVGIYIVHDEDDEDSKPTDGKKDEKSPPSQKPPGGGPPQAKKRP